jgi:hypothetical protein
MNAAVEASIYRQLEPALAQQVMAAEERIVGAMKTGIASLVGQQLWPAVNQEAAAIETRIAQTLEQHVGAIFAKHVPALEAQLAETTRRHVRQDVKHLFRALAEAD